MNHPTVERVREALEYDADTGLFVWKISQGRTQAGYIAGCLKPHGYIVIRLDGRACQAHNLAWLYVTGEWPPMIDHVNGTRWDNRFENLRVCDNKSNSRNRAENAGRVRGVRFLAGKYVAQITVDMKAQYLGRFDTEEEASAAYRKAQKAAFGEFVRQASPEAPIAVPRLAELRLKKAKVAA